MLFNDTYREKLFAASIFEGNKRYEILFGAAGFEPTLEAPKAPALPLDDAPTWC